MRSSNLFHVATLLANLFEPESFEKYIGNANLARYIYSISSVKLLASLGTLFSMLTINLWANQGTGIETNILLRYSFASILTGWLPTFILDVVPIMSTSAYYVNL